MFTKEIITNFEGFINGVSFDNEEFFDAVSSVLTQFEISHGVEAFSNDFILELKLAIHSTWLDVDDATLSSLESELCNAIKLADEIENVSLNYYGSDWAFEFLNKLIQARDFTWQK